MAEPTTTGTPTNPPASTTATPPNTGTPGITTGTPIPPVTPPAPETPPVDYSKELHDQKSWLGRQAADLKNVGAKVDALLAKFDVFAGGQKPTFDDDEKSKFDEKIHEMMMEGRTSDAINLVLRVKEDAEKMQKAHSSKSLATAFDAVKDEPIMKNPELAPRVQAQAEMLVGQGYKAADAVLFAKTVIENEVLKGATQDSGPGGSLDLLGGGGGGTPPASGEKVLQGEFEEAYQKAFAKGLFKDRKEYIAFMSPALRKEYGL